MEARVPLTDEVEEELEAVVSRHRTMEDVVRWALASKRAIASIVVQDEYTHDVVVPFREGLVLVYDTT